MLCKNLLSWLKEFLRCYMTGWYKNCTAVSSSGRIFPITFMFCGFCSVLTPHMPLYILPFLLLRLAVIISEMGLGYNCWTSLSAGNNMDCCRSVFSQCNLSISQILLSDPARLKHRIPTSVDSLLYDDYAK